MTRLIESPLQVLVNFLVDLLYLGPPRNKTRYPYPLPKRNTFPPDHVAKGDINLKHVHTEKQLADIFTKSLDEKVFCRLRGELNIIDASNME